MNDKPSKGGNETETYWKSPTKKTPGKTTRKNHQTKAFMGKKSLVK